MGSETTAPVPILLYHAICSDPPDWIAPFTTAPADFARHLDAVLASGARALTVSQYVDGLRGAAPLPSKPVLITFDDGFADFADTAVTALTDRGLASTLYVATGSLRDQRRQSALPPAAMLSSSDLAGLEAAGVEIGAHSHTHRQLDTLPAREVAVELARSADLLAQTLGHRIRSVAYPYGYWRSQSRRLAEAAGFDSGCAVGNALTTIRDHPLALSRLTVRRETNAETIAAWLSGTGAGRTGRSRRLLACGWRQCRRVTMPQRRIWLTSPAR